MTALRDSECRRNDQVTRGLDHYASGTPARYFVPSRHSCRPDQSTPKELQMFTMNSKSIEGASPPHEKKETASRIGTASVPSLGLGILLACAASVALADGKPLSVT